MNEADTRANYIDPQLIKSGWGVEEDSKILREHPIAPGRIKGGGTHGKSSIADYVLVYKGRKLAVIEAKSNERQVGEGVAQAKDYANKLKLDYTYAANGKEIYEMCMKMGTEAPVNDFPTPVELWNRVFGDVNKWRDKFNNILFENANGTKGARFYQEIAVNFAMDAIANNRERILLTLATGTGKTFIAFQIAWKLFKTRWNLKRDGLRRPRILFLADRNFLANQAFNAFSSFEEDALVRINPKEIRKNGRVPTNGGIFFTIFQTFMCGENDSPYFGEYPTDFFDFIIIDECHRGGANNEGTWHAILEYFSPAVQLGLTATPKRNENADTYKYFGEPVYIYSLKEGINDGFLTPFKVKRIETTIDEYIYVSDDKIVEGEIEEGRIYQEPDFNQIIEIKEREAKRVQILLSEINQNEKTIVFCANQDHAAAVRDLINHYSKSDDTHYCVRVTANDGALGEQYLREFQDNEKMIPTILTTSQKLSTGVDARNIRNIVLLRSIGTIIEFKQIIGRGTRLYEGKEFFTIFDFVKASLHFADPEWDGEPLEPDDPKPETNPKPVDQEKPDDPTNNPPDPDQKKKKIKIKLGDGKEREIQHMVSTFYWSSDGKPMSAEEFIRNLFGTLPDFFKTEDELRKIWSNPKTRKALLAELSEAGYGMDELVILQSLIDAEKSDLFDVLEYISFAVEPLTREIRVAKATPSILSGLDSNEREFLEFVLSKYIETGVEELDQGKLHSLLTLKYSTFTDARKYLGDDLSKIAGTFVDFQKYLYEIEVA